MRIRRRTLVITGAAMLLLGVVLVACTLPGGQVADNSSGEEADPNVVEPCGEDCVFVPTPIDLPALQTFCGVACDPAIGANCDGGLECISGTCLNPDICLECGRSCTSDADCPAEYECTEEGICYNKSICIESDTSLCGASCQTDNECSAGLECYGDEFCWSGDDPSAPCTEEGCGQACLAASGPSCPGDLTCIKAGFCGGTHSQVCDGCGSSCETSEDCPGNLLCVPTLGKGNICWNQSTCQDTDIQFPSVVDVVTPEVLNPPDLLIDPKTGFPIDPLSGLPIDPTTFLPLDPISGEPFLPTECKDDAICTGGEQANGSCRDCSGTVEDLCGVPCPAGLCSGGLTCSDGVCWDNGVCGGGGSSSSGNNGNGQACACTCTEIEGLGTYCVNPCDGIVCQAP